MKTQKKLILFVCATVIVSLCLTVGYVFVRASNSRVVNYLNKQLGIEINGTVTIRIGDDSRASCFWAPKVQEETISKVLAWLTQATLYKGQIPEANFSETVKFSGNIMPSHLAINWAGKSILLQPANYLFKEENGNIDVKYVEDVVMLEKNGQKTYIVSHQLYKWLKDNEWKTEFKQD